MHHHKIRRKQAVLVTILLLGDAIACFAGGSAGYWIRFVSALQNVGVVYTDYVYASYIPVILWGTLCFVGVFGYLGLYDPRRILQRRWISAKIVQAAIMWLMFFLSISLVVKFHPPVSRIFAAVTLVSVIGLMLAWRNVYVSLLNATGMQRFFVQRIAVLGWGVEVQKLVSAITQDYDHPYEFCGTVVYAKGGMSAGEGIAVLGEATDLQEVIREYQIDVVVIGDVDIGRADLMEVTTVCERMYIECAIIPTFFQIFTSSLRMQTISGVPILGFGELKIDGFGNRLLKRSVDILGGFVGVVVSAPVIAALALLIKRESKGSVIYEQKRTGIDGQVFTMYKLRSMRVDAEQSTGPCWATADDPRRLKIGAFMRTWNLDELPQFWNVLCGDMSLVGPRPERPELIRRFERSIPHYNPRHRVRPGLTGWAQVNGLRGNTSLVDRIKYDLFYIENWSIWLDLQILAMTLYSRKNAY